MAPVTFRHDIRFELEAPLADDLRRLNEIGSVGIDRFGRPSGTQRNRCSKESCRYTQQHTRSPTGIYSAVFGFGGERDAIAMRADDASPDFARDARFRRRACNELHPVVTVFASARLFLVFDVSLH